MPNEPDLVVAVSFLRTFNMRFGPLAGKKVDVPTQYVGASAREVSCELPAEDERQNHPASGDSSPAVRAAGKNPEHEPPWTEVRVEVPSSARDARTTLEREISYRGGKSFQWFLMRRSHPTGPC